MNGIVYVDLKPDYAKIYNLPIKLPVLILDFKSLDFKKPLPLDVIIRGLSFEYRHTKNKYYKSYLIYFLYEKFKHYLNDAKFQRAQEVLKVANSINNDYRSNFFNGMLLKYKGDLKSAEVEFRKAIYKDESFIYARFELAKLLYKNEEFDEAINELEKVILTDKNFSLAYNLLSDIYIYQQNYNEALKVIIRGLGIDDEFQPFYEKLFAIYNDAGYFSQAVKFYDSSKSKIKSYKALYNVAFAFMNIGELHKAIEILESVRNENKDYIYELLGRAYKMDGKYDEASKILDRAYSITLSSIVGISYANSLRSVLRLNDAEKIYEEVAKSGRYEALFFSYYMYENYFDERAKDVLAKIEELLQGLKKDGNESYFAEFEYIIKKKPQTLNDYLKKLDTFLDYYFINVSNADSFNLEYEEKSLAHNLWMPIFFRDDMIFERMVFENAKKFHDKIILLLSGYIVKYLMRNGDADDYILSYLDLKISPYYAKINEILYKAQKDFLQNECKFREPYKLDDMLSNIVYSFLFSDSVDDIRGKDYLKGNVELLKALISFKTKETSPKDFKRPKDLFLKKFLDMINYVRA